ncbi:MAG: pitrilysin family protein [Gemmatimonadota bacterium]
MTSHSDADRYRFKYEEQVLANGLHVVVHEEHSTPVVAVHVMYHVGSKNERKGRTGFAHLFEHLLFQGSENVGDDEHIRHVQNAGGTLNGSTWFDRTNYFETVPSNQLDLALWLESDRMGFFLSSITQEKLDNQRDVVKNERLQSYENRPYGLAVETVLASAYPEGHPYRHPTIGYMKDLDEATLDDVRGFFQTYYGPGNAVLVIAGDVRARDAFRQVERYFGGLAPANPPPSMDFPADPPEGERRAELTDRVQAPRVYMMYHAPSFADPVFEVADVLASLLAEGRSSVLYNELVYRRRVASEVQAFTWPLENTGMLWIVATARPGTSAADLEAAIDEVLGSVLADGAAPAAVAGARNRAKRQLVRQLADVGGRADTIAHAVTLRGDAGYVNQCFERYAAVQDAHIGVLARQLLRPERRTVVHVSPVPAEGKTDAEVADVSGSRSNGAGQ